MNILDEILTTQQGILARLSEITVVLKRQENAQKTVPVVPSSNRKTSHNYDELQTIPEHAACVKCCKGAVYKRIKAGKMPPGSVVYLPGTGAMRINWTVYAQAVRIRPS